MAARGARVRPPADLGSSEPHQANFGWGKSKNLLGGPRTRMLRAQEAYTRSLAARRALFTFSSVFENHAAGRSLCSLMH